MTTLMVTVWIAGCLVSVGADHTQPNILFLMADDLRVQLGFNTRAPQPPFSVGPQMVTPNLDALADRSLIFHRAYAQQAVCNPSRSSALTGRRPDTTRVYSSAEYFRESGGNFTTIPQFFKEHGYTTLGMGKIFHPGDKASGDDDPMSWSEPFYVAPNHKYWKSRSHGSNKNVSLEEREHMPLPDEQVADKAIESIRRLAEEARDDVTPFFLAVGFHKPHLPFIFPTEMLDFYPESSLGLPDNDYAPVNMPSIAWHKANGLYRYWDMAVWNASTDYNTTEPLPSFKVRELRRAYYACVTFMDTLVGRVLDELEAQGLEDDTIVVFWGDHGWHLGEHGAWSKQTNFELATRVPVMLRIPGVTDRGMQTDRLVEMVDLFPTLVEAAGFTQLSTCPRDSSWVSLCTEGRSLLPLVQNPQVPWKDAALSFQDS